MIDRTGKQLLITSVLCLIFFAIGMLAGGWIIWKQFKADQDMIKKEIVKIQKNERLANSIIEFLDELAAAGITIEQVFETAER